MTGKNRMSAAQTRDLVFQLLEEGKLDEAKDRALEVEVDDGTYDEGRDAHLALARRLVEMGEPLHDGLRWIFRSFYTNSAEYWVTALDHRYWIDEWLSSAAYAVTNIAIEQGRRDEVVSHITAQSQNKPIDSRISFADRYMVIRPEVGRKMLQGIKNALNNS
jgi:hypothetical protein